MKSKQSFLIWAIYILAGRSSEPEVSICEKRKQMMKGLKDKHQVEPSFWIQPERCKHLWKENCFFPLVLCHLFKVLLDYHFPSLSTVAVFSSYIWGNTMLIQLQPKKAALASFSWWYLESRRERGIMKWLFCPSTNSFAILHSPITDSNIFFFFTVFI